MRIEILDQAERDLVEGFRFYEDQGVTQLFSFAIPILPYLSPL
jgi:hypothetical protein